MYKKIEFNGLPYLVNVPVKIMIWIRSECQKTQFEVIKKARPSILFLQSDGGRTEEENAIITQNREMILNSIDWNCTVHLIFEENNKGIHEMCRIANSIVWREVDRCIVLEDDQIPSVSLFEFCAELLEKYKDDYRVQSICCVNIEETSSCCPYDYFFSEQGMIWSFATWRRSELYSVDFSYFDKKYDKELISNLKIKKQNPTLWKMMKDNWNSKKVNRPYSFHEFWTFSRSILQNQLIIIPSKNLITCYGDMKSTNSGSLDKLPPFRRRLFRMKRYEIEFPISHPEFVIKNVKYSSKYIKNVLSERPIYMFFWKFYKRTKKLLTGYYFKK